VDSISRQEFNSLICNNTPLLDVRAEVEFLSGAAIGAFNAPLLKNDERAIVGTTYKQHGQDAAIKLGHELVSGDNKSEKISTWINWFKKNSNGVIYCARGGLRSKISQEWLSENGIKSPRIEGGYKNLRQHYLESIEEQTEQMRFLILSGPTGSGKTLLLRKLPETFPVVDLEKMANHRGSAFGGVGLTQPPQAHFENDLATRLIKLQSQKHNAIILEDESRMIGRTALPVNMYKKMKLAEVFFVEVNMENRVLNIFQEYIQAFSEDENLAAHFEALKLSLQKISKKLGGALYQEISNDLSLATIESLKNSNHELHQIWIKKLLTHYYDPIYKYSLEKNHEGAVKTQGNESDFFQWVADNTNVSI
jgi:tRNA 2-selenouridine synthase